jgi:hypothetical protein
LIDARKIGKSFDQTQLTISNFRSDARKFGKSFDQTQLTIWMDTQDFEEGECIDDECITSFNADDWDDSALIEAWDSAKNEYLKHHALEQDRTFTKKQKITDVESLKLSPIKTTQDHTGLRNSIREEDVPGSVTSLPVENDQEAYPIKTTQDHTGLGNSIREDVPGSVTSLPVENDQEASHDQSKYSQNIHQKDLIQPVSPDQLNALMAWYWAGYYTAKLSK